jgi:CBS domain containing-hemolysin-like protein
MVTLENVLERIVGPVEDEFDIAEPNVVPAGPGEFIVNGLTPLDEARRCLDIPLLESNEADTVSGLLMESKQNILTQGDKIELEGAVAEVLEIKHDSATKIRFRIPQESTDVDDADQD